MITLIHGTDIVFSRKFFLEEKEKYPDISLLDGEKITLTDLVQIFEGGSLFEEQKTVFIERLFTRKKGGRKQKSTTSKSEFELLTEYLEKQKNHTVFLWEGKELEPSSVKSIPTAIPRVFKLPQTLFAFLDSIKPGNGKQLVTLFHDTVATTDPEMVFFMLVRQIRLLLALSPSLRGGTTKQSPTNEIATLPTVARNDDPIDELKRMQPWQKTKLQQQANLFTSKQLTHLYQQLFLLELGQKTGSFPNSILTNIDFFLLEI